MMIPPSSFHVQGRPEIRGTLAVSGNKNAVLPMIAAALLTDQVVTLENVPDIVDVRNMIETASVLGAEVNFHQNTLVICAKNITCCDLPAALCRATRTSFLFVGALLAREGRASFFPPGGDVIGRRRLDTHFYGLGKLGAVFQSETIPYRVTAKKLSAADLFFDEASVTATEHLMIAAVLAEGTTIIRNAAAEPSVQDLGEMLRKMGAVISGLGTNTLTIEGVRALSGVTHTVSSDPIEAGSFLCLAAALGGELTLTRTPPRWYWMIRRVFERFNIELELSHDGIHLPGGQQLRVAPDFGNAIPVVSDGPWPQYPTDMMPCTIVMATQAVGTVLFFEKMFESRLYFVDRLIAMGANAVVCDPHRVVISGPARLRATTVPSPDIRAGMAMLIAAFCADGVSVIQNAEIIDRGYEHLVEKLRGINCVIRREMR